MVYDALIDRRRLLGGLAATAASAALPAAAIDTVEIKDVIASHHAVLFGEMHEDPELAIKYLKIFTVALQAGRRDVVLEAPPSYQEVFEKEIQAYADIIKKGGDPIQAMMQNHNLVDPSTNFPLHIKAALLAAAAANMEVHAVDVAPRELTVQIGEEVGKGFLKYAKSTGSPTVDGFLESLTKNDFENLRSKADRDVTASDVRQALNDLLSGRANKMLQDRVQIGDKLIANQIKGRLGDRPFVGFIGRSHSGQIDETKNGYADIDLDGALRLMFGADNVATVDTLSDRPAENTQVADFSLTEGFRLKRNTHTAQQAIAPETRARACKQFDLKCGP